MAVTTINAYCLLETSEAEDVNISQFHERYILNTVDEEKLLTPEDEHGGSEDEIQMDRNLLAPLTDGQQQRSNHLVFVETKNDPPQKSRPRRSSGLATECHPKERTKRSNPLKGKSRAKIGGSVKEITGPRRRWTQGPLDTMRGPILQPMKSLRGGSAR